MVTVRLGLQVRVRFRPGHAHRPVHQYSPHSGTTTITNLSPPLRVTKLSPRIHDLRSFQVLIRRDLRRVPADDLDPQHLRPAPCLLPAGTLLVNVYNEMLLAQSNFTSLLLPGRVVSQTLVFRPARG